ncbi:MAG TPA: acetate--CoA ligase family protein [Burkholderiales bacterium]|nr:acetate--CoA ligase family protein [Burkholderiales bacterium]
MREAIELIQRARREGRAALDEPMGKALLAAYGIAVPRSVLVHGAAEVTGAIAQLMPPFVAKVVSPDILHKSDAGGVKVRLQSAAEVQQAIAAMGALPVIAQSRIEGFLVEEMAPPGQEIVIGGVRDADFGPLVMVGLGGIFVEVLADVAFRICPITPLDAEEMIAELKGRAILEGARGGRPVSKPAIVDTLLKLGGADGLLMRHRSDIREADVNPLIVSERGAIAVDARFVLT